MSWLVFIEEPGDHQYALPYGVLAGLAVEDRSVWSLARKLKDAETQFFGQRLHQLRHHFTMYDILDADVLKLGVEAPPMDVASRTKSAWEYFAQDHSTDERQIVAASQSRLGYCQYVLSLLHDFRASAFSILMPTDEVSLSYEDHLRKDYVMLFERISYFLASQPVETVGMLVLNADHPGRRYVSTSVLTDYFEKSTKGRQRSRTLMPEPLIANSSLATINNAAALFSYVASWGFRLPSMKIPKRQDLDTLVRHCNALRFQFTTNAGLKEWSFRYMNSVKNGRDVSDAGRPN